ncbi:MAG: FAD-dependent oxidoreductase, partial [Acidimicrobiales bacterium]
MDTITLSIEGMTCEHCEHTVEAALVEAGAREPRADFRRQLATFGFEGDPAPAAEAVRAAGYRPGRASRPAPSQLGRPVGSSPDGGASRFDLVTIGSGSAAFAAAIRATNLGAKVAMVEAGTVGGTCVNVGCIPSKALLAGAGTYHLAGTHPFPGVATSQGGVDMSALVAGKDEVVATLRNEKYLHLADSYGFEIVSGHGTFTAAARLAAGGRELSADAFLIATGSAPFIPPIPGLAEAGYLTSTTAMALGEVPESLVVIGGNYIGLEMGQLFADLGVRVTIVEALECLAPGEEPEVSTWITQVLEEEGIEILTSATVVGAEAGDPKALLVDAGSARRRVQAAEILVAAGRRPVLDGLGLDAAGVSLDERGRLVLDDELRTTNPNIYAAG